MKTVGIIGINGFAGRYLRKELETSGYDVWGVDIQSFDDKTVQANMLDATAVDAIISEKKPDYLVNLAGQASPGVSWERVVDTMHMNIDISVNIIDAVRKHCPNTRMLFIGSANQYDTDTIKGPINESAKQKSGSPYAVSKVAQESLLWLLAEKFNLDIIMTRSFNHIGPGQRPGFVVTDYCTRIVALERGESETMEIRSMDAWRDFADVRDTVRAYRLLLEKGHKGEVYNVGSGKAYYIQDIIASLISMSEVAKAKVTLPDSKKETGTANRNYSDNGKIFAHTGFEPKIDICDTLKDVLNDYRSHT